MGKIVSASKVKLICAVLWNASAEIEGICRQLTEHWGSIDARSTAYDFNHTAYYADEFGERLRKQFFSFEQLVDVNTIPDIKILGNELEEHFFSDEHRNVNIDPGYIANAKLVMPTTKNLPHRVYIGKNIYADLQLIYKKPTFQSILWTFADYKEPFNLEFFNKVRERYMEQIANERQTAENG
ncbi:DUF4416 family protein [bacterium]|nr:DUF4416 family protein [bacterium]